MALGLQSSGAGLWPLAHKGSREVYECPHRRDLVHYDGRGCPFRGSLPECLEHVEVCPHEAAEVRHLADSMARYLRRHPKRSVQSVALVREAVQRLEQGELDVKTVAFLDGEEPREAEVRGLAAEPMQRRLLGASVDTTSSSARAAWQQFLSFCLPGFKAISIRFHLQRGEHLVEDMLDAYLRNEPGQGEQDDDAYVSDGHSARVWRLAIASAELAAATTPAALAGNGKAPTAATLTDAGAAKVLGAIGVQSCEVGGLGKVLRAFRSWDTDGNGSISKPELFQVMHALDSTISDEDLETLFNAADGNKDSCIDYNEFVEWLYH